MQTARGTVPRFASKLVLLCAALLACPMAAVKAQDTPSTLERRVKAAFVYKFAEYVEWPSGVFPRADEPLKLGVAGDDQLAGELAQLVEGRRVHNRPLSVKRVASAEQASDVHVLFVGRSETARMAQLIKVLPPRPMLIVSESEGALDHGSIINLLVVDGRVRFEISQEAAEKRRVRLSSRLLALAQNVRKGAER